MGLEWETEVVTTFQAAANLQETLPKHMSSLQGNKVYYTVQFILHLK